MEEGAYLNANTRANSKGCSLSYQMMEEEPSLGPRRGFPGKEGCRAVPSGFAHGQGARAPAGAYWHGYAVVFFQKRDAAFLCFTSLQFI